MTYPSKYPTSTESLRRLSYLSERIVRYTKSYEEKQNYHTWESIEIDVQEKQVLSKLYLKQIEDEQR